ncbi:hypothetical protein C0J50_11515 [Silurus asotus]|uniref:Uncharacterized protein n=1 Tax=Silurus asotus TaxID=30991 RepID=A0AAD5ABS8_SILAS|nr:hypothetical protein C0J50_11515 [Silurus asotus]
MAPGQRNSFLSGAWRHSAGQRAVASVSQPTLYTGYVRTITASQNRGISSVSEKIWVNDYKVCCLFPPACGEVQGKAVLTADADGHDKSERPSVSARNWQPQQLQSQNALTKQDMQAASDVCGHTALPTRTEAARAETMSLEPQKTPSSRDP